MNNKLLKHGALLIVLMVFAVFSAFAQLSTVYVDVTNGSNTYTGANPTNNPAGTGPVNTIAKGLSLVANNGTVVIFAGDYAGGDGLNGAINITTGNYANLVAGGSLTLEFRTLNSNNNVNLTAGNFTYDVASGTLTVTATNGTEYMTIAGSLNLGNTTPARDVTVAIANSAYLRIASSSSIIMNGVSSFSVAAPQKTTNISLTYNGDGTFTAGPESNYGSFGTGTLTVAKTAGTTITFANPITQAGIVVNTGNATFNAAVSLSASTTVSRDIINNGALNTVTFNNTVGFTVAKATGDGDLSSVINTSTGTINFNGPVTWTANTLTNRNFGPTTGVYAIENASTGTIAFNSTMTLVTFDGDVTNPGKSVSFIAYNHGGTLTLGALTAAVTPSTTYPNSFTLSVNSDAAAGTVNIGGGTFRGFLTNVTAATMNVNGATTVTDVFTNGGTVNLAGNTLTLNGSVAHLTNGGTVTASSGGGIKVTTKSTSFNGGALSNLTINDASSTAGTITIQTNPVTLSNLTVTRGTLAVNSAVTVDPAGTTLMNGGNITVTSVQFSTGYFTQSSGTFTQNNNAGSILDVKRDFNRTGGTFTYGGGTGSKVQFTGTTSQTFNGGPLIEVGNLTFTNTAGTITVGQSVRTNGNVLISPSTTLALGTLNIILKGASATMTNNGTYTASGGGGIVFGGFTTVSGGTNPAGQTITGTGVYSYITIDVGSANVVSSSGSDAKFNGVLRLVTGDLSIADDDFAPTGTSATVVRDLSATGSVNGVAIAGGTFNSNLTPADYDLQYTGSLTTSQTLAPGGATGAEFSIAHVKNITFSTTEADPMYYVDLNPGADFEIKGDFTLSPPDANIGGYNIINLPTGVPRTMTLDGALTVGSGAELRGGTSAKMIVLATDNKTHTISGTITSANVLTVTGNGVAVNGSTVTAAPATVKTLDFEPANNAYSFTSTNLKAITGDLTIQSAGSFTGAAATITMNPTSSTLGGNLVVGGATSAPTASVTIAGTSTSSHVGSLTLNAGSLTYTRGGADTTVGTNLALLGGTLTLGSNVTIAGTTNHTDGNLALGSFNLGVIGAYTHNSTAVSKGTITGTGVFVIRYAVNNNLALTSALSVPNVRLANTAKTVVTTLTGNALTVTNALTLTKGTFDLNAKSIIVSGNTITTNPAAALDVPFAASGGGTMELQGAALLWTSGDDVDLTATGTLKINSTGTVTLQTDDLDTPTPRTWTAGNITITAGNISTGINNVTLNGGVFDRTASAAGSWSQTDGYLILNSSGTNFKPGTGFAIDNLEIDASVGVFPVATATYTVNKNLYLKAGTLTTATGNLVLGAGATIKRAATTALLSSVPTFGAGMNLNYSGTGPFTQDKEMPAAALNNLTVTATGGVVLANNITVNGTLTLATLLNATTNSKTVTMGPGAAFVLQAVGTSLLDKDLVTSGGLNITYDGTFATSTRELGALNTDGDTYATPTGAVTFKSGTTSLQKILTIGGTATFISGNLDMNGKTVTVNGDVVQTKTTSGFFVNTGASKNLNFGGANTALTLKATWAVPLLIKVKLAKAAAENLLTLSGGDLDFATNSATLYFGNGVLVTGSKTVILKQATSGGQPTQGFDRSGVTGTNKSHVFGQVKKFVDKSDAVAISRVEFPVGTQNPNYRPFAIYFKNTPQSSVNITVSHSSVRPGGQNGYPIRDGGLVITNYPDFFWYVKSDISLAPSYLFDMEAQAEGYADYAADGIQNVRFVRRDSGLVSNQWVMQKNNNTNTVLYDNSTIAANWPAVKVVDATGGITTQGSIFTFSQINKAPTFSAAPTNMTVNEGDTVKVTFTAFDPDLGDLSVLSSVTLPTGATFNAVTGLVTWPVGYDLATAATPTATRTITIRATDTYGPLSKDSTITITVNNKNRAPSFTATGGAKLAATTINDGQALAFTYIAVDGDGDAVTYVGIGLPTGATVSTAGVLAWTPTFAQAGTTYTVTVVANDAAGLTDTATAVVTVNKSRALGDVDGNGTVQAADASLVLQHVAGLSIITDPAALYAADASINGTISAFDAAKILQAAAGLITLQHDADVTLAKQVEAAGSLIWSSPEATKEADVMKISLGITNAANVYAVQLSGKVDENLLAIDAVNAALPEGWEMKWNVVNNELRVAMAGATPLPSGSVATVMVRLKNKESRLTFSIDALLNESVQPVGAVEIAAVPTVFALAQNYPNPFNPSTTIKYQIATDANVTLDVYNLQGQKIRELVAKEQKAGYYSVVWDGRNEAGQTVSSGLYLYRVQAGSFVATHKMLLIK